MAGIWFFAEKVYFCIEKWHKSMKNNPLKVALFVLTVILSQACLQQRQDRHPYLKALDQLDQVLAREQEYDQFVASQSCKMRQALEQSTNPYERFRICDNLFEEYFRNNVDSALAYAYKKEQIARSLGNPDLLRKAQLDFARRYIVSGMYFKAKEVLDSMEQPESLPEKQKASYYQAYNSLYHGLVLTVKDSVLRSGYLEREAHFRQLSFEAMTPDMLDYYTVNASLLLEQGQPEKARQLMLDFEKSHDQSFDNQAIIHYWIAKTYREEGNLDKALEEFATSARYDFIGPYKASRSLMQTAKLLLEKGQIVRAYHYITRNYRDAVVADARICLDEIADFMPDIIVSHEMQERKRVRQLILTLSFILLLLVVSIIALGIVRRLQKRIAKNNQEIKQINASLARNVDKLKEANNIKDSYLGRYLSMFSSHINSLERYRSSLRSVAKSMNLQEILQALRSDSFIDQERDVLYEEFDRTFLGVFPHFVEELNLLLEEDKRIGIGLPEGKLTNELRIFALIRLGVKESGQIASFLKKSPSTIYNYRVKLRNACVWGSEAFEEKLMEIGKV